MENLTQEDLDRMIAEAEERGYSRARSETESTAFEILSNPRPSIWD